MSSIKNFINNLMSESTNFDESDGQFMFFNTYPYSKSKTRPLSNAELQTRGYDDEWEKMMCKVRSDGVKAKERSSKNFYDVPRKKV